MHRNIENLESYKQTMMKVLDRASNMCEVLIEGKRCGKFIPFEEVRYINFLHKATRNGKSDAWILDPKNIGFGCASHHIEEERSGVRMKFQEYNEDGELQYILEY